MLISEARGAQIRRMVVTMGAQGAVFATLDGEEGYCPAKKVDVKDTTGAGDAFFAGTVIGQTYGKTMMESCEIGTRLAASVITTGENVCPRYLPSEFGLDASAPDDAQLALELCSRPQANTAKARDAHASLAFCAFFTARTSARGFLPQGAAPRLGPHRRQSGTHTALSS